MQIYPKDFFEYLKEGSRKSAKEIVPFIIELVQPQSVVDVGCGTGEWLFVFKEHGIEDICGIDGEYVNQELLEIPQNKFLPFDLTKPLKLERRFDLVVSLEVAEHLPSYCAETFVNSLTEHGSVILFSAAIPHQKGTNHINEQWLEYWNNLFNRKGYVAVDCIRNKVWQNDQVDFWFAQNMVFFVCQKHLNSSQNYKLQQQLENTHVEQLSIVHPKKYLQLAEDYTQHQKSLAWYVEEHEKLKEEIVELKHAAQPKNMPFKKVVSALPVAFINAIKRKFSSN